MCFSWTIKWYMLYKLFMELRNAKRCHKYEPFNRLHPVFTFWCYVACHAHLCEFCKILSVKSVQNGRQAWRLELPHSSDWLDLLVRSVVLTVLVPLNITMSHDKTPCNLTDRYRSQNSSDWYCPWRLCFNSSCTKLLFISSIDVTLVLQQRFSCVWYWCL